MDSFEFNKIAGAVLFTLLVVMGLNMVTDGLFATKKPEKPGWDLPVAAAAASGAAPAAATAEPEEPLAVTLAKGDAAKGEAVAKQCAACHSFDKGGANKVGPNLFSVLGAKKARTEGFRYSQAMADAGKAGATWTYDAMNAFLKNPKAAVPGTSMGFAGLSKAQQRADMIAYLRKMHDAAPDLPK